MAVKKKKTPQEKLDAKIKAFMAGIEKLCRKHELSIAILTDIEDGSASFAVEPFNEESMHWLKDAVQCASDTNEPPRSVPADNRNWKEKLNIKEIT